MADQLQIRGGDTASNSSFTGAQRELSIDTSKNQLIVHDGATPGGHPIPTTSSPVFTGDAELGGDLTVSGAAEFASYVSSDTFFWSKNTDSANAGLYLYNYDGNPNRADAAFAVSPTNGSTAHTVTIDYDGKAAFSSTVRSNGGTATNYAFLANGSTNTAKGIGVFNAGGANVAEINLDGSAKFVGQLQVNGDMRKSTAAGVLKLAMLDDSLRLFDNPTTYNDWTIKLSTNGNAAFNGTVTATVVPPSDARFKENIEPAKPQLADVVALGGILKNYDWNEDAPVNEELRANRQLGLIAQEAEEICPHITKDIARTKQGKMLTPEKVIPAVTELSTDEEGVTTTVIVTPEEIIPATYEELDDSYKGITTDVLIMKLLGGIAELTARVEELENA